MIKLYVLNFLILNFIGQASYFYKDVVTPANDQCSCTQLLIESDCLKQSDCSWTQTSDSSGKCSIGSSGPKNYCQLIAKPSDNCSKTKGCAYVSEKCEPFAGCTAYVQVTNYECQAISYQCVSNGKHCTDAKPCSEYTVKYDCEQFPSSSGIFKCKWKNGICRDYICTDAEATLTTDSACNTWMAGCITTGLGCTKTLGPCSEYYGNYNTCPKLTGIDGKCEIDSSGTNCQPKICSNAPTTITSDSECEAYQTRCLTNGKGCASSPLPPCATYKGNNLTCLGYIGSDGSCEGDVGGTICRSVDCSKAPTSNNTDKLCKAFKVGCVTTGKGCTGLLKACSSYSGTITTCSGYIGTDGYCKGVDSTEKPCQPKLCNEAANTLITDQACQAYQIGCKTTGKGCTSTLGSCSGYQGTIATCQGYIGTEGNCKGTDSINVNPCAAKVCTEAPTTYTTNEACAQFQKGCVSNGAGCVAMQSCLNTIKQISCEGTQGCTWNSICVSSQDCTSFPSISVCLGNKANGKPCKWTGTFCRNLQCTDAESSNNTDSKCNSFLAGCITNGKGCVEPSTTCDKFQGTKSQCEGYSTTTKCYNIDSANSSTPCIIKSCQQLASSTSDSQCEQFLEGCLTNGQGCINKDAACSAYKGTQSQCNKFKGSNQTKPCWNIGNATSSTACIEKLCTHNSSADNDTECEAFLSGCIFNGQGCVERSQSCTQFQGNQNQCGAFKAENGKKICWSLSTTSTGACKDKVCEDASTSLTSNAECEAFLAGCVTNGAGCLPSTAPCTSYKGTMDQCAKFIGNGYQCYKNDYCTDRQCSEFTSPKDNNECQTYLSKCRYYKGKCVVGLACTSYAGSSLNDCSNLTDTNNLKCWWISGAFCTDRTCDNAPSTVASQADCNSHVTNCLYEGNKKCVVKGICTSYKAYGNGDNCKTLIDTTGNQCWFESGSNCTDKSCSNASSPTSQSSCDTHKTNCRYLSNACIEAQSVCTNYSVSGTDTEKRTKCSSLTTSSNTKCSWSTGNSCENALCSNALAPTGQPSCDTHLANACSFKYPCKQKACSDNTTATTHEECMNWDAYCPVNANVKCCRWTGIKGCIQGSECMSINVEHLPTLEQKKAYCLGYITLFQQKCFYPSMGGICMTYFCMFAQTGMANLQDCETFKSDCYWNGETGCIDKQDECSKVIVIGTSNQEAVCNGSPLTTTTKKCQKHPTNTSTCQDRTCEGNTTATSNAICNEWLAGCQWNGTTGCEKKVSCVVVQPAGSTDGDKDTFCKSYITSDGIKCFYTSGATCSSECQNITSGMTNFTDCNNSKAGCQWNGATGCEGRVNDCATITGLTASNTSKCNDYTPINGDKCSYFNNACVKRTCLTSDGLTTNDQCEAHLPDSACILFNKGGCINRPDKCSDILVENASEQADKDYCAKVKGKEGLTCAYSSGTKCTYKCNTATGMTKFTDCQTFLTECQWDGGSSCLVTPNDCASVVLTNVASSKSSFCLGITTKAGSPCAANDAENACINKTCARATGMTNFTDCNTWMSGCQWDGGSSCMDKVSTCSSVSMSKASAATKQALCEGVTTTSDKLCLLKSDGSGCEYVCSGATSKTSFSECEAWKTGCQWNGGTSCADQAASCATVIITNATTTQAKQLLCSQVKTVAGIKCNLKTDGSGCQDLPCNLKQDATNQSDCINHNTNCRYNGTPICITALSTCENYVVPNQVANQAAVCESIKDDSSKLCFSGTPICEDRTCSGVQNPTSQVDCDNWKTGCKFVGNTCANPGACSTYNIYGNDNTTKRILCANVGCGYVDNAIVCTDKACSNVHPTPTNESSCTTWLSNCRWNGIGCVDAQACTSYSFSAQFTLDSAKNTFCSSVKDNSSPFKPCIYVSTISTTTCQDVSCANYPGTPTIQSDCKNHFTSCSITYEATAKCIDNMTPCSGFTGTPDQCKQFIGNGKACWQNSSVTNSAACIDKTCAHNTTAKTNEECASFLTGCKTNGNGCIESTVPCSQLLGNKTTCSKRIASDGISLCNTGPILNDPCQSKTCYDDGASITDAECKAFKDGCVTNGSGCIPDTEPCSSYLGDRNKCSKFTGNKKKCWNSISATSTSPCIDKTCQDDTESTTDNSCSQTGSDCVTKGKGCLQKSLPCSSYQGVQSICAFFKGSNGTKPCWNTSTATSTSACIEKACNQNSTATSDTECDTFIPRASGQTIPTCVTNGAGCVDYPRKCSLFTGTEEECGKFTASDGPCKSLAKSGKGACAARICTEAVNTYNTDALCKAYHPTCVTTGNGCVTSVSCKDIQESLSCSLRSQCLWVQNCREIKSECSLTTSADGASVCVNTPVSSGNKQCAWQNDKCQAINCEDFSAALSTHEACQTKSSTCTTSGYGCIPMGPCTSYANQRICNLAKTTDKGDTCLWESNSCRAKKCTDALDGTSDEKCNSYLSGCKSNGKTCISTPYTCSSLVTAELCMKDSYGKLCLFVDNICYNFEKCEDIEKKTHSECQKFSNKCTTDGTKCIAITSCEETVLRDSCVYGTDGDCGWLVGNRYQTQKCQKFRQCSDSIAFTIKDCQAYGSKCITDLTKCIDMGKCASYQSNQAACQSDGTDGPCHFESGLCRLRECRDSASYLNKTSLTHAECASFVANTKCTTNGISCIPLSTCDKYSEKECHEGTDGVCIYAKAQDSKSDKKSCRVRVCGDLEFNNAKDCAVYGCIYNSYTKRCNIKANCAIYQKEYLCRQGGVEGECAYIPQDGICFPMKKCSNANSDRTVCDAHSDACYWEEVPSLDDKSTRTLCKEHDCESVANGTDCNPAPSYDGTQYTICVYYEGSCSEQIGTKLSKENCYTKSKGTYRWNEKAQACQACFKRQGTVGNQLDGSSFDELLTIVAILIMIGI